MKARVILERLIRKFGYIGIQWSVCMHGAIRIKLAKLFVYLSVCMFVRLSALYIVCNVYIMSCLSVCLSSCLSVCNVYLAATRWWPAWCLRNTKS